MSDEKISAGLLKATDELLALESPDLRHHIASIGKRGPLPYVARRGQSSFLDYQVEMRADDAAAILAVLESAVRKYGEERKFFDHQLNYMTMVWMGIAARLRAKPE